MESRRAKANIPSKPVSGQHHFITGSSLMGSGHMALVAKPIPKIHELVEDHEPKKAHGIQPEYSDEALALRFSDRHVANALCREMESLGLLERHAMDGRCDPQGPRPIKLISSIVGGCPQSKWIGAN
jgi:hypothetical protein